MNAALLIWTEAIGYLAAKISIKRTKEKEMANALDEKFNRSSRKKYILGNSELTATCEANSLGMWHAVLRFSSGETAGATFADEHAMRDYLSKQTKYELKPQALPPRAAPPAFMDVAAAKEAMLESGEGRRYDPRIAASTAPAFSYPAETIQEVNTAILKAFIVTHQGAILDHPYNIAVLQRGLQDMLDEVPGMLLNDENIQRVIDWLNENKMLFDGTNQVQPYRKVGQIVSDSEEQVRRLTAEEVARRAKLPLAELQKLVEQETGQSLGAGLTPGLVRGSNPKQSVTATVTPLHDISEEEKSARALSTEELRAIEIARQRANRKESRVYGQGFPEVRPSGRY